MGHQTKIVERNGSLGSTPTALARDVGEFAHDVFTLAELQVQLFAAEVREYRRCALIPGLVWLAAAAVALACFPVALIALALSIVESFQTSYAAGFLLAAIAGAVLSAVLCVVGWFLVRGRLTVVQRSRQELVRNVRWVKRVLERDRTTRGTSNSNSWRTVT